MKAIDERLPWYFWLGFVGLLLFFGLMMAKIKPFSAYAYIFLWWSYIIAVDALVFQKKGCSLLSWLKAKIFILILFSFFFWLFFEFLNLRISNWRYVGYSFFYPLEKKIFVVIAFGTVLPAILETFELLKSFGFWRELKFGQWKQWGKPALLWIVAGIIMLILPLIWPKCFFWTIWLAVIFILDPIVDSKKGQSIFSELRKGEVQTVFLLLVTGLICGILWEFWNYWALLKWIYTVPFIPEWKFFEMPIFGYFGFPFFAVECYVFYQFLKLKKGVFL